MMYGPRTAHLVAIVLGVSAFSCDALAAEALPVPGATTQATRLASLATSDAPTGPAAVAKANAAAAAAPVATGTKAAAARSTPPRDRAVDRLQLETTAVTGNRELPKVMSIVPWKGAEPPAGPDRPMGSLVEEMLAPLDRDEFRREITYYREIASQSAATVSAPGASNP